MATSISSSTGGANWGYDDLIKGLGSAGNTLEKAQKSFSDVVSSDKSSEGDVAAATAAHQKAQRKFAAYTNMINETHQIMMKVINSIGK